MLRKLLTTAGAGALVAMAIGGVSLASASGGENGGRTIVVIEKTTSQHVLDLGKPGPTPGDTLFLASQFWNTAQTHQVGALHAHCVIESKSVLHCIGTGRLFHGTLEFAGEATFTGPDSTFAITGGTGEFDGAEGHVSVHSLNSEGTLSRDTIVLLG
jgi:hypothetical protein